MNHARKIMFQLTKLRRFNPDFLGSHVHIHGTTRHTAAALLLHNPSESVSKKPCKDTILEIQKREDMRTFEKHYFHLDDSDIAKALEYGSAPGLLKDMNYTKDSGIDHSRSEHGPKEATPETTPETTTVATHVTRFCSRNAWRKNKRKLGQQLWQQRARAESDFQRDEVR